MKEEFIITSDNDIYELISKYCKEVYDKDVPPDDVAKHNTIVMLKWLEDAKRHYGYKSVYDEDISVITGGP